MAKLEAVLSQGTNDLSEALRLLADLLSIPTIDRPPLNLTPQKRKERTLRKATRVREKAFWRVCDDLRGKRAKI